MAELGRNFDASEVDTTQTDYELLPTGIYKLEVSASDVKTYDDGNTALAFAYDVIEPEQFKGRKIFVYIDWENSDAEKQQRGERDFAKLCRATGIRTPSNTEDLHFYPFIAKVQNAPAGVSKAGNAYKAKNRVQTYYFNDDGPGGHAGKMPEVGILEEAAPASRPANDNRQAAKPAAQPAAAGKRPWGSKAA